MKTFTFQVLIELSDWTDNLVNMASMFVQAETVDRAEQKALVKCCERWNETPESLDKHRGRLVMTTHLIDNISLPLLDKQIAFGGF